MKHFERAKIGSEKAASFILASWKASEHVERYRKILFILLLIIIVIIIK